MTETSRRPSYFSRPVPRLLALGFVSLFIAAPTPGNVGGCGGNLASTQNVVQGTPGNATETAEYNYFDRGLCSSFCWRLRDCNVLCEALSERDRPMNCQNDSPETFAICVRGGLHPVFGFASCPHLCPSGTVYRTAYEWDVEACGQAVYQMSCGRIQDVFRNTPTECLNVCQVQ